MKKLFLILFVLCSTAVLAQSRGVTQTDDEINNLIFSGQWLQAKTLIEQQIRLNPDHPKYYFMKAYMFYLSRYFTLRLSCTCTWNAAGVVVCILGWKFLRKLS